MKKITAIVVCMLLVASLAVTAFAAQSVTLGMTANKSTVSRGDVVEFSISVSEVANLKNTALTVTYDKTVFEFVSGACTRTDANLPACKVIGTALSCSFSYDVAPASVSGELFNFKMKVLDTAAFGESVVTFKNTVFKDPDGTKADVTFEPVKVTVECDHSWGDWTKGDATNHERVCSICGKEDTAKHAWDAGKVTTKPTCKTEGVKTFTCATCAATKTEAVATTDDHTYGAWVKVDDTNHKHACTECGKEETAKHAWDAGEVTTKPDCKNDGVKTYTCKDCKATKTEVVPSTNEHGYGAWEKVDENTHKHACTGCGKEETADHAWDDGKVTTEPTCKDEGVKTYTCADCKATKTEAVAKTDVHTWGDWASVDATNHKRVCSVCAKEETAAHAYDELVAGETTHWSECVCGAKTAEAPHAHDTTKWVADGDNHWHACACGDVIDEAAHTWGEDKKCSVCGVEKPTNPDSGDNAMILAFVALMVLSAAGVAVTVIGKKRIAR